MGSKDEVTAVARKSTLILFVKLALTLSSWVGFLFVARFMGVETWGLIGFALGLAGIFFQTDFGFAIAHNKKISEGKNIEECIGAYIIIKTVLISALVAVLLGGLFIWEGVLGHGYQDPIQRSVVMVILLYFILFSIAQIPVQTFGGLRQSAKQQVPEFVGTFARMPVMVFVALSSLGVVALAYSYVVTGVVMLFISLFLFRKFKIKKPSKPLLKSYTIFAAPVAVYLVFSAISLNIDKVAIQFFWNSTEVGYFFGMQRVALILTVIAMALLPIMLPSISYYHSRRKFKTVRRLIYSAERYTSMILVPVVVIFCILSAPLIHILVGDEFLPGTNVLAILSIYALFLSLNSPHIHALYGYGKSRLGARIGIIIASTNMTLLFVFVPRKLFGYSLFGLGAEGAALASMISVMVGFVVLRHYTRRVVKVRFKNNILKHWLAGIIMALFLMQISDLFFPTRWFELLIVSGVGMLSYLAILIALKEFTKKDLHFFMDILNPRKLKKYVSEEFKGES